MKQLAPNTLLQGGKYKIEKVLGQGSFGITYLAEHTALGKKVCIKEFFMKEINTRTEDGSITGMSDGSLSYNYAKKFQKEAMNLSRLDHPNIVRVTDSFGENGTFYYVMDYINGMNLNDYVKRYSPSEKTAVEIVNEVANALLYMHEEKQMLHLDLKPGNIMRRKGDGHIFLIDFGLSKHYDSNGAPETSTNIGLGTPGYAPSEQGNNAKNGEFRPTIDVYALGATLYKLLTRETPPHASEIIDDEDLLADNLRSKGVSELLIAFIVKAMMPSAKKRIQTMQEFLDTLPIASVGKGKTKDTEDNDDDSTLIIENKEDTELINKPIVKTNQKEDGNKSIDNSIVDEESDDDNDNSNTWKFLKGGAIVIGLVIFGFWLYSQCQESRKAAFEAEMEAILDAIYYADNILYVKGRPYEMKPVKGGTFLKGANTENADVPEIVKATSVNDFSIGSTEITEWIWSAVMGDCPLDSIDGEFPMANISWEDCQLFIRRLNEITKMDFRLPTEAEWEFAARGGTNSKDYLYSGSNNIDDVAWYDKNSEGLYWVAQKKPNELGLYDMSGNLYEYTSDLFYWNSNSKKNIYIPEDGTQIVIKGGCYNAVFDFMCLPGYRMFSKKDFRSESIGFRLALSM